MEAYKVLLKKIESNHNNLRTNEVEGYTLTLPKEGTSLVLTGESLTPGMTARLVHTTEIKEVQKTNEKEFLFKTQNSTYQLTVLEIVQVD